MESVQIVKLFSVYDRDLKGYLDKDDFSSLCTELNLEINKADDLFNSLDLNRNGKIEKQEFVQKFNSFAEQSFTDDSDNFNVNHGTINTRCSTPISGQKSGISSWDKFLDDFGHVIFGLQSYENIRTFFIQAENNPSIHLNFVKMIKSVFKDIGGLQETILELESSITRVTKQSEVQLNLLEEEMEAQIRIRETKVRDEEKKIYEEASLEEREKFEKQIAQLQDAVNKLKQVDDKLSEFSPYSNEMEMMREKLREVTAENSDLRIKLNESETAMALLRSQITTLKVEIQEKTLEQERQNDAVTMALSEHENMSRHVNSLYSDNRRLLDSNDDLRVALDSNLAVIQRYSVRANKSTTRPLTHEFISTRPNNSFERISMRRNISPRSSILDMQALSECDPGFRTKSFSADDEETENEISFRSSIDGSSPLRKSSIFEPDSGIGTLRDDNDSEIEASSLPGLRNQMRYSKHIPTPPLQSFKRNSRKFRLKEKRASSNIITDIDISDENFNADERKNGEQTKLYKKRKLIVPNIALGNCPLYKVILCGDVSVGKSSFIVRFCQDEFRTQTRSTLGLDFRYKNVRLSEEERINLQLWDTAGQERFRSIATSYFRKADGVILIYDVTSPSSFINVRDWMEQISESVPEGTPVLICGNKIDLRSNTDEETCVNPTEGAQLAASYGVLFMETSAYSGINIENGVIMLARHLLNRKEIEKPETIKELDKPEKKINCC